MLGELSMGNIPHHQPGLIQAAGKYPHRVEPRFQAEETVTHLASLTSTHSRTGWQNWHEGRAQQPRREGHCCPGPTG